MTEIPREKQYKDLVETEQQIGRTHLGLMMNQVWNDDPRRLAFVLARYKFVAKMLSGSKNVLEVGCGDGFPAQIVAQSVEKLSLTDFDPVFVKEALVNSKNRPRIVNIFQHDLVQEKFNEKYDAIYLMDVLEHIDPIVENEFLSNLAGSVLGNGVVIIGIPSLESQEYASKQSKEGHVNCKTGDDFHALMKKYFDQVFLFSMNDEVVHTGFNKMAHYLIALCVGPK